MSFPDANSADKKVSRTPYYGYRSGHAFPELAELLGYVVIEDGEWVRTELPALL